MNIYMLVYSFMFWALFSYNAIEYNNGHRPLQTLIVILLPIPFMLQAMGII